MRLSERIFHAVLFEAVALLCIAILIPLISEVDVQKSVTIGLFLSLAAMVWNVTFNAMFDRAMVLLRGTLTKSLRLRVLHATLFEASFVALTLPPVAWWLELTLWSAVQLEAAIIVFVLIYTFVFNLIFDRTRPYVHRLLAVRRASRRDA
jgi:uncharacterized membrane protein